MEFVKFGPSIDHRRHRERCAGSEITQFFRPSPFHRAHAMIVSHLSWAETIESSSKMADRRSDEARATPMDPAQRPLARGPPASPADFLVVGIGASAGGLDACRQLLGALPAANGMAFILVQHLDPTHESMMVDLLAGYTSMAVRQATDGMPIERDHLYIIPPGTYLSVTAGALHLSQPWRRRRPAVPPRNVSAARGYRCRSGNRAGRTATRWRPWSDDRQ
jgi:chemotaxis response regulator CheB